MQQDNEQSTIDLDNANKVENTQTNNYQIPNDVDVEKGLTSSQVEQRIKDKQVNNLLTKTSKSYAKIFFSNIFSWLNIICFVIAGMLISVGSYKNTLFLGIFLSNLLIGLIQEIRAKRMVDSITVIINSKIKVLRNGEKIEIEQNKVVKDEIFFIENGEQICADGVVLSGCIEVNESLLTGESKPIKKRAGDALLGGSFVVSGQAKAIVTKVGLQTYSSTLIKKAREVKASQSDILKTLNIIIKSVGVLLIPLGILTFLDMRATNDLVTTIEKTAGSVIGMMPVGMFLLTSVSLVVGVINLAKKRTLVQDLYSIEMLARTNVLCLDKTGTLTDGTMSVNSVLGIDKTSDEIFKIMQQFAFATQSKNSTSEALDKYFWLNKSDAVKVKNVVEFSSERKFSAVEFEDFGTYMLGAPEFVSNNIDQETKQTIKHLTTEGYRVLLLCQSNQTNIDENISKENTPIAIISIQDNIREDAKDTIAWFNSNGVQIKIISGDNVDTVSNISKKVGVVGYEKCISLENMSNEEVAKCALEYNIFGRVTPEQKCIIVKTLKKNGDKVAMTGDGVNDILALKEADCSIAMASGSEATRSSSNLIMLDNNFSAMPSIVAEGRRVINNISKSSSLFLTKTFFTIFLTIFVLISQTFDYPLQPNQILLWESLFIGIPAFFLALQPSRARIEGSFIASLSSKALPGALVLFFSAISCYIYCSVTGNLQLIPTLISYCVTFGAFFILLNLCLPLDKYKTFLIFSMLTLCVLAFIIIPNTFFDYQTLSTYNLIFVMINLVAIYIFYVLLRKLFEKIFEMTKNKKRLKVK